MTESFKISPDPQLIEKVRDVVGLYMNPPTNAAVFSFDEKSQIQALERAQPILPMDIGTPVSLARRRRFERTDNHGLDVLVRNRARRAGPWLIVDALQSPLDESLAPLTDGRIGGVVPSRHRAVQRAVRARQHETRTERRGMKRRSLESKRIEEHRDVPETSRSENCVRTV